MTPRFQPLYDLDRLLRAIPGARTETRAVPDVLQREVAALGDAHRARSPAAAAVVRFARWKLGRQDDTDAAILDATLGIDEARDAIAKFHRYASWTAAEGLATLTVDPRFERAADAIVDGDADSLRALLAEDPSLARARSAYGHHATLLQHVAANGIEESRQWQSPPNAVAIARVLLDAGAEPDATCDCYDPTMTAMTLLVSSAHPAEAGVQVALVDALLDAGARVDGLPAQPASPLQTALAFGYPAAADALVRRGARIESLVVAAGMGRADLAESFAERDRARIDEAFRLACALGRTEVATLLLRKGADAASQDNQGFTGMHWAAWNAHLDTVRALLDARVPLEVKNIYGGTVLDATVWAAGHDDQRIDRVPVVAALIAAGADVAKVTPRPTGLAEIDALLDAASASFSPIPGRA